MDGILGRIKYNKNNNLKKENVMWFHNRIILVCITLLLSTSGYIKPSLAFGDAFPGSRAVYRVSSKEDKGNWFKVTFKFNKKRVRVYAQQTKLLIAQFGSDDTVTVGMHREISGKGNIVRKLGLILAPVVIFGGIELGDFDMSNNIKTGISSLGGVLASWVFPEHLVLKDRMHFKLKRKSGETLYVKIGGEKEQEFYCKISQIMKKPDIQSMSQFQERRTSRLFFGISPIHRQVFAKATLQF
ncbi:MAG: hypothetical protein OXI24_02115 [Candidatus Poribacteria bacterium]|nr:hypothetical protein [Candidatus Poribacteria bacterium]